MSTVDEASSVLPVSEPPVSTKLLPQARIIAQAHHASHGNRITPGQLAVRMRVGTDIAEQILDALGDIPAAANTTRHTAPPPREYRRDRLDADTRTREAILGYGCLHRAHLVPTAQPIRSGPARRRPVL